MAQVRAGLARVTITPPVGMYLTGMERDSDSHGLRDDLYATALAFDDGETETVIVNADVLFFHPQVLDRVRAEVESLTGIPGQNLMFSATHAHSGPVTFAFQDSK